MQGPGSGISARIAHVFVITCLTLAVAGCGGGSSSAGTDAPANDPPPSGNTLLNDVNTYMSVVRNPANADDCPDPSRAHLCPAGARSGTRTGKAVHDWIRDRLTAIPGMRDVQQHPFTVPRFAPDDWHIRVTSADGSVLEPASMPWFFSGFTGRNAVQAPLLDIGSGGLLDLLLPPDVSGRIVIIEGERLLNAESGALQRRLKRLAERGAAAAVVFFPDAPGNEIVAQNWDSRDGLAGIPVLLTGKEDGRRLQARAGEMAEFLLSGSLLSNAQSRNTMGWLPGHDNSRWIVVGTPLNSWLLAGAERGPGIAILLALAQRLGERVARDGALPYPVYFVGSGGHEIFQFGLQRFLSCTDPGNVGAYVHLGSGLVSRAYSSRAGSDEPQPEAGLARTRTLSISENLLLRQITGPAFSRAELQPLFDLPPAVFRPGESRVAWQAGIPMVSLSGTNPYHHTAADDDAQIVAAALGPMRDAFAEVVDGLLDSDLADIQRGNTLSDLIALSDPDPADCAGNPAGFSAR